MAHDAEQRERLKQKFATLHQPPEAVPAPATTPPARTGSGTRRRDFKGERRRLNPRLPAAIADELDVLCLAAGVDKNSFCEDLLRRALEQQFPELRKQFTPEQWDALQRCAANGK